MSKLNYFFTALLLGFVALNGFSQETTTTEVEKKFSQFTLNGEIRPRWEMGNGYKSPAFKDQRASSSIHQRSRLNFAYKANKVSSKLVLQDVRNWGSQKQLVKNEADGISIHEAWAQIELMKSLSIKAGRMEVVYDDHRIFGSVGWADQARSHDLFMLKYDGFIKADVGFAFHNNTYQGIDAYRDMQFLHLNGKVSDLTYSFLFLNNGKAKSELQADSTSIKDQKSVYSMTVGPRLVYKAGALTAALNFYYQLGQTPGADWVTGGTETDNGDVSAYDIGLDIMYKVNDNFKAGIGFEQLSGNSYNDDGTQKDKGNKAFTPFYGTNHKFNGWMDYFYVGNHGNSVGLTDINLKLIYKKGPFFVKLIPHYFLAAGKSKYTDKDGNLQDLTTLGTEIDLWAGYHFVPKVASIQFGYSHMIASDGMYALKTGDLTTDREPSNWAWVMLVLKPNFLNISK